LRSAGQVLKRLQKQGLLQVVDTASVTWVG